ncbi:hypothetical protein ZWY2020_008298 [Hordeum vulgare]|nr:hypothetical protein ZWY2020_008298 [Hordeum vulgare]
MTITIVAADVYRFKAKLGQVKQEVAEQRAAAVHAKAISKKSEARVNKVQQELKETITKNEALEQQEREHLTELTSVTTAHQEAWKEAHDRRKEVHQIKKIADGKRYLLQCTFGGRRFVSLNQMWSSPSATSDLPKSVAHAEKCYASQEGAVRQRLFWALFQNPEHAQLASDQLKQLTELHKMTEPTMKDLCIRLWSAKLLPGSYFGLVQKLIATLPQIDVLKHSVFIEGARMAFRK